MKYISIEQLLFAVHRKALTVCSVTSDCVHGFSTDSADCSWYEDDAVISDPRSKAYLAIDPKGLIGIEKSCLSDGIEYEVHTNNSIITIDVFKKGGDM